MPSKEDLRLVVKLNLDGIIERVNRALHGEDLGGIEHVLVRLGRGGNAPHWLSGLKANRSLPNLDGKTIGSVIEMILVAVIETELFTESSAPKLRINPARGVDLPDLDLGVKSPSENYCTSEPFFSAYERLLGSEYDAIVLLTDYQTAKSSPPLRLQIINWKYLNRTQIADANLCKIARKCRTQMLVENETWTKKIFRFLAFVNQSDWRAKRLLFLLDNLHDEVSIRRLVRESRADFEKKNKQKLKGDKPLIPGDDMISLESILSIAPLKLGVIDAVDNWVIETQKEAGRFPSENEWNRFLSSPLDGEIGMSFALQWRFNFGKLFGQEASDENE
jgi:hypothetical protein